MYQDHERQIFGPVFNGTEAVYFDPLEVEEHFYALLDGDPNAVLKDTESLEPMVAYRAWQRIKNAVCEAFGLPKFDPTTGQGARLADVRRLLDTFLDFRGGLKKNTGPSPTSAPPTASAPAPSTTPPSSGCGCN